MPLDAPLLASGGPSNAHARARRPAAPPHVSDPSTPLPWQAPAESLNTAFMLHRPEAISMTTMLDEHVTPVGLPLGLTDMEKQMWIAVYAAARKLVALGECATAEEATKQVTSEWGKSKGKDSRAFIFALRWSKSINVLLNMKQARHVVTTPVSSPLPLPPAAQHEAGLPPMRDGLCLPPPLPPPPHPNPNMKQDFRFCDGSYQEAGHS